MIIVCFYSSYVFKSFILYTRPLIKVQIQENLASMC